MKKILAIVMVLAVVSALVVPLAVSADPPSYTTGGTEISGNVNSVIEVSADSTASINLVPGTTRYSDAITAKVNSNTNWTLTIVADNGGYMSNGTVNLQNHMTIKGGSLTSDTMMTGSSQTLATGSAGDFNATGNTIDDIVFGQKVTWTDGLGIFNIKVTFTGTGSE